MPFEATAGEVGPHLLLLVSFAEDDGAERLADAGCLVVRRIDLELADGEEIGVTRMGFRFLWVVATEDKPECLEGALLVS